MADRIVGEREDEAQLKLQQDSYFLRKLQVLEKQITTKNTNQQKASK